MKQPKDIIIRPQIFSCDICGKKIVYPRKCKLCGKKVCNECHKWYDITKCNDSLGSYCIECWELGTSYRVEMEQLAKKYNSDLEKLEKEWSNVVDEKLKVLKGK